MFDFLNLVAAFCVKDFFYFTDGISDVISNQKIDFNLNWGLNPGSVILYTN